MKYDNLIDYDFIREMRDNFEAEYYFHRGFIIPEEEVEPGEEIHPILGMLGVVDNEEDLIENEEDLIENDDDEDVPEEVLDQYYYWEIDHFFADENFFDGQFDYLYEIDNLFKYKRINDEDMFIMLEEDIFDDE